jgi:hypothetical protein
MQRHVATVQGWFDSKVHFLEVSSAEVVDTLKEVGPTINT